MALEHRRVLALIPAHDEGPRIDAVVRGASRHLPVLVVDDGSTDDTATTAEAAGATVISQRPNQGKGAALRAGFRWALADLADAVVTLDGDGQHDPAELPGFITAYRARSVEGRTPELIVGRRDFSEMPASRRLANALGTAVLSLALGRSIPDNQSGYRLIGRRRMTSTLESTEQGFEFEVEMIAICLREGWDVEWVPIRTIYGAGGSHIRPLRHLRDFVRITLHARRIVRSRPR
jgi:glycosyltransferase involved in cell wall biosynthesis